jgi:hypothetical protein
MKRWHQDYRISYREWQIHRRQHVAVNVEASQGTGPRQKPPGFDPFQVDCRCDDQVGRFRKTDAGDCGNARCLICHSGKFPKREPTRQELAADLTLKEEVHAFQSAEFAGDECS